MAAQYLKVPNTPSMVKLFAMGLDSSQTLSVLTSIGAIDTESLFMSSEVANQMQEIYRQVKLIDYDREKFSHTTVSYGILNALTDTDRQAYLAYRLSMDRSYETVVDVLGWLYWTRDSYRRPWEENLYTSDQERLAVAREQTAQLFDFIAFPWKYKPAKKAVRSSQKQLPQAMEAEVIFTTSVNFD